MNIDVPTAVVLDTTPLGLITQRPGHIGGDACRVWYETLRSMDCRFYVPEIADYELRRKMLHIRNAAEIARLEAFNAVAADRYRPLTTADVHLAAQLWAQARQTGHITAPPEALDSDVLIAAQARLLTPAVLGLQAVTVATSNVRHFIGLVPTALWSDIRP